MHPARAIYVDDERDMPSESDDEDDRLDCVHDIHYRQVADQYDALGSAVENYYYAQGGEDHINQSELQEDQKELDLT